MCGYRPKDCRFENGKSVFLQRDKVSYRMLPIGASIELTSADKTGLAATLGYDGEGRLNQTVIAGVTSNLGYDGSDLVAIYDSAGTLLRRFVHGPGIDQPLVWYEGDTTANKTWLYADHQGSIVATANSAGTNTIRCANVSDLVERHGQPGRLGTCCSCPTLPSPNAESKPVIRKKTR